MLLIKRLKQRFFRKLKRETDPAAAYDSWSSAYDNQPDNLMLALDEVLAGSLLDSIDLQGKNIADIGCGTGRHWKRLIDRNPQQLFGYDVSAGMLTMLKQKFPEAKTFLLENNLLPGLEDQVCDLVMSTLTIAHIADPGEALKEWCRVLKPGGTLLITDYHPEALAQGARRTFSHGNQTVAIRNYVHSIKKLTEIARQLGLKPLRFNERKIDESVKSYYDKQGATAVYEKFYGTPIIYGLLLIKSDAASPG